MRCQTCYLLCFISHNLSKSEAAAAAAGEEAEKVSPPSSAVRPQASLLRPGDAAQNSSSVVPAGEVHARSIHFNHLKKKNLSGSLFFILCARTNSNQSTLIIKKSHGEVNAYY